MRVPTAASILALASASSLVAALTVTAPSSVNQCQDATFQIGGNEGVVHLSIVPSVDPCEHDALLELGPFTPTDGKFTWPNVNITAGTTVLVVADDASGAEAWTDVITIGGSASDCEADAATAPRTTATVNNVNTAAAATATRGTNSNSGSNVPVNAGSDTTDDTSGAISIRGSPQIGAAALLAAVVAFFV